MCALNEYLIVGSYQKDVFLQMISSNSFTGYSVIESRSSSGIIPRYWENCLVTQKLSLDYESVYDHLRGYGFGRQFVDNEGIYGTQRGIICK